MLLQQQLLKTTAVSEYFGADVEVRGGLAN